VDRALGLDHRGVVGSTDLGSGIELLLLFSFYAFQKAPFLPCFTCFQCMFLQNVNSTGTSGNTLVAKVYVYRSVCFPPFWTYVGGINVSITTANMEFIGREKVRAYLQCIYCKVKQCIQRELSHTIKSRCTCVRIYGRYIW
jgi:hypothetical protein